MQQNIDEQWPVACDPMLFVLMGFWAMADIAIAGMAVKYRALLLCVSRATMGLCKHEVEGKAGGAMAAATRVANTSLALSAEVGFRFIWRMLWEKLPMGGRMGHSMGNGKCPICGRLEDHEHLLRQCLFSAISFDTVRKAFGVVQKEMGTG